MTTPSCNGRLARCGARAKLVSKPFTIGVADQNDGVRLEILRPPGARQNRGRRGIRRKSGGPGRRAG